MTTPALTAAAIFSRSTVSIVQSTFTAATSAPAVQPRTFSDKVDRWVTAPVLGPVIFLAVMWLVFQITTAVAAPLQGFLGDLFSGPVSAGATWLLAQLGLGGTWVEGLVVSGIIAGVGMLLTFVPLMTLITRAISKYTR